MGKIQDMFTNSKQANTKYIAKNKLSNMTL
jgi:hypothetical protein